MPRSLTPSCGASECILCHRTRDPNQYAWRENPQGLGRMMPGGHF